MTPLMRVYERLLPRKLVLPCLTITYAVLLFVLVGFGKPPEQDIVYIDLEALE